MTRVTLLSLNVGILMNSVFGLKITTNGHAFQDMEYDIVRAEEYGVASGAHSRTVHNGEDLELQIHTGVESSIIDPRDKIRLDYDPKFPWLLTTRDKRVFLKKKLYDELVNDEAIKNLKEHAAKSLAENQPETDMAYNDQPRKELDNKLVHDTSEGAEIVTTKESESPTDESRTSGEQIDLKNSRTASAAKIESQSPKNQPKKPIREQINLKTSSVESSHKEGPDKELLRTVHDTFTSKSKEINFDPQSQDPYGIRLGRGKDFSPFENSNVPLVVTSGSHEEVTSASGLRAHPQSKEVFISGESTDPTKAIDSENNIFPPESQLKTTLSTESVRAYSQPSIYVGTDGKGAYTDPTLTSRADSITNSPYSFSKPPSHHLQVTPSHPAGTTGDDESSKTTADLFYSWENISHSDPVRLNSSPEASAIPKNSAKETLIWVSKTGKYEGKRVLYWSTVYRNQKHTAQIPKNTVITKNNWRSQCKDGRLYDIDRLSFHKGVFTNYDISTGEVFHTRIMDVIDKISQELISQAKLMMTEDQFIEHHFSII
ncbi:hypothetical protein PCASD_10564 [Puccinia coronata f. sp. avenae]|uniref:Uncharacterized protein n=2 Tax=Puccinia coronata f. sp. avenae TaxID=200324 RepID=A0A2N5UKT8_9BASI|nr:hypothetical protein PCASD_10564 [Puccinia coronata f. sp. avenae]